MLASLSYIFTPLAVLLWLGVAAYFVRRYALKRVLVSLSLAAMALGWSVLAASEYIGDARWAAIGPWVQLASLGLGSFVVFSIVRTELREGGGS